MLRELQELPDLFSLVVRQRSGQRPRTDAVATGHGRRTVVPRPRGTSRTASLPTPCQGAGTPDDDTNVVVPQGDVEPYTTSSGMIFAPVTVAGSEMYGWYSIQMHKVFAGDRKIYSPTGFECAGGKEMNRKWKLSLRIVMKDGRIGQTIGQWLEAHGLMGMVPSTTMHMQHASGRGRGGADSSGKGGEGGGGGGKGGRGRGGGGGKEGEEGGGSAGKGGRGRGGGGAGKGGRGAAVTKITDSQSPKRKTSPTKSRMGGISHGGVTKSPSRAVSVHAFQPGHDLPERSPAAAGLYTCVTRVQEPCTRMPTMFQTCSPQWLVTSLPRGRMGQRPHEPTFVPGPVVVSGSTPMMSFNREDSLAPAKLMHRTEGHGSELAHDRGRRKYRGANKTTPSARSPRPLAPSRYATRTSPIAPATVAPTVSATTTPVLLKPGAPRRGESPEDKKTQEFVGGSHTKREGVLFLESDLEEMKKARDAFETSLYGRIAPPEHFVSHGEDVESSLEDLLIHYFDHQQDFNEDHHAMM